MLLQKSAGPRPSVSSSPDSAARPTGARRPLAELKASSASLAEQIAVDAARRDLERELPFDAFRLFRESGLGALRLPEALGGPGGSIADYVEMTLTIGSGDSNVAHALRSHFAFTETLALSPDAPGARAAIDNVLQGKLYAAAHTELGTPQPGQITTSLSRIDGELRLNGRKWYATGTAYADFASITARTDDGALVNVMLPVGREGFTILDDWDGMGQRLTASGGVLLDNVLVSESEVRPHAPETLVGRHNSSLRQLHLAAAAGGAVRAALRDGIGYVRRQARVAAHSTSTSATDDPFVQKIVGEMSARSYAIDALLLEAARKLDDTVAAFASGDEARLEASLIAGALATARTQIIVGDLALAAAEQIFELGGGSATSRKHNFDRHWRNIRTVLSHNPLLHKARIVGDHLVNGTTTHLVEGKVF
jgi:alkylation response protein AidB-like acyl-CoA dehydrogenase